MCKNLSEEPRNLTHLFSAFLAALDLARKVDTVEGGDTRKDLGGKGGFKLFRTYHVTNDRKTTGKYFALW